MSEPVVREDQIDKPALLRRAGIFAELAEADVEALARLTRVAVYPAGDEIIEEGAEFDEETDGIFVVVDGAVEVRTGTRDGSDGRLLVKLGPGEFFGEMALLDGRPRSASVTATEETQCLVLHRWDFLRELRKNPEIGIAMLSVLSGRIRATNEALGRPE
ncbi:MAG TPA: cyclic nucleotide-binding domain-containing protein [Gaiellaceae bacterium]|jgi:CRP-like cAMP-binding protein